MKTLKHVFAVVLTLALLFALTAPAFADPTGSITVMEPGGHTYQAYKIFSVEKLPSGELQYTAADPWKTAIINAVAAGQLQGVEVDATTGVVLKLANYNAADFAAWAKTNIPSGATAITLSADATTDKMTTGPIDPGYYLVVPNEGTVASLCTVLDDEVAIQNKNDMPFDKEAEENGNWVNESGVQVGDVVNFKITGKVPTLDATQESYFYLVSDRLTEGLTLLNDGVNYKVTVKIDDVEVDMLEITDPNAELRNDHIRFVYIDDDGDPTTDNSRLAGFDLSLDMLTRGQDSTLQGKTVEITYSAQVNPNAVNQVSTNFATLDYGDEVTQHHKDSETKHYTSKIVIDKYETGSAETKVAGAKFVLKNAGGKFYAKDGNGNVEWKDLSAVNPAPKTQAEFEAQGVYVAVTNEEGNAEFEGLEDATYSLVEIEAPTGYALLTEEITVVVDGSGATTIGLSPAQIAVALSEIVRVANTPGTLLPSTGGIGTTIFYIGGGVLVLAAIVVILLASRKKNTKANN